MKRVVLLFAVLYAMTALSSSVEWGAFQLVGNSPGSIALGYVGSAVYANTSVNMMATKTGNTLTIAENDTYLAAFSAWTVAVAGEIVNSAMLQDIDRLFYRCDGIQANNPFEVNYASDSFYMAFETLVWDDEDFVGKSHVEYGWVHLDVTNGKLSIIDSAMGLEGQSMIVGGGAVIPEPTSALLSILGVALMALKRRKCHGACSGVRPY